MKPKDLSKPEYTVQEIMQILVISIGAGLGIWGAVTLLEGCENEDESLKRRGLDMVLAGGNIAALAPECLRIELPAPDGSDNH